MREVTVQLGGKSVVVKRDADGRFIVPDEVRKLQGWNVALKPAHEPIVVARKPLSGTVMANVLQHGTGALNIDGCRIGHDEPEGRPAIGPGGSRSGGIMGGQGAVRERVTTAASTAGRWPANLVLSHTEDCRLVGSRQVRGDARAGGQGSRPGGFGDVGTENGSSAPSGLLYGGEDGMETVEAWECVPGCPVAALDEQSGERPGGGSIRNGYGMGYPGGDAVREREPMDDTGGASRFFYCAKSSSAERNAGLDGLPMTAKPTWSSGEANPGAFQSDGTASHARNVHPTVKPIELMRWLVRLVTSPGGIVLDPFAGSGTTGIAAVLEGFDFVGVERDDAYAEIARARIAWWAEHPEGLEIDKALQGDARRRKVAESGQGSLLDALGQVAA